MFHQLTHPTTSLPKISTKQSSKLLCHRISCQLLSQSNSSKLPTKVATAVTTFIPIFPLNSIGSRCAKWRFSHPTKEIHQVRAGRAAHWWMVTWHIHVLVIHLENYVCKKKLKAGNFVIYNKSMLSIMAFFKVIIQVYTTSLELKSNLL